MLPDQFPIPDAGQTLHFPQAGASARCDTPQAGSWLLHTCHAVAHSSPHTQAARRRSSCFRYSTRFSPSSPCCLPTCGSSTNGSTLPSCVSSLHWPYGTGPTSMYAAAVLARSLSYSVTLRARCGQVEVFSRGYGGRASIKRRTAPRKPKKHVRGMSFIAR